MHSDSILGKYEIRPSWRSGSTLGKYDVADAASDFKPSLHSDGILGKYDVEAQLAQR